MTSAGGVTTENGLSENDAMVGQFTSVAKVGPSGLPV